MPFVSWTFDGETQVHEVQPPLDLRIAEISGGREWVRLPGMRGNLVMVPAGVGAEVTEEDPRL